MTTPDEPTASVRYKMRLTPEEWDALTLLHVVYGEPKHLIVRALILSAAADARARLFPPDATNESE